MKLRNYAIALALCLFGSGCAVQSAQVGVQSTLTVMAEGVNSAGLVIMQEGPAASDVTRDELIEQVEVGLLTAEQAVEIYRRAMQRWAGAIAALEVARQVLLTGQSALDVWVESGELPDSWGMFCNSIEQAMQNALTLVSACGVDVPEPLVRGARLASEVCGMVGELYGEN